MKSLKGVLFSAALLLVILVMSGCSSTAVYSDFVKGTNFNNYKTYAWLPNIDTAKSSIYNNQILQENLRQQVNRELIQRGMRLDTSQPDFLVLVHLLFEKKSYTERTPIYSSYPYYFPDYYPYFWYPYYYPGYYNIPRVVGYDIREVKYTQGSVVVDIIDRTENKLIWRGWTEKRVEPQNLSDEMAKDVKKIFKKFPVDRLRD